MKKSAQQLADILLGENLPFDNLLYSAEPGFKVEYGGANSWKVITDNIPIVVGIITAKDDGWRAIKYNFTDYGDYEDFLTFDDALKFVIDKNARFLHSTLQELIPDLEGFKLDHSMERGWSIQTLAFSIELGNILMDEWRGTYTVFKDNVFGWIKGSPARYKCVRTFQEALYSIIGPNEQHLTAKLSEVSAKIPSGFTIELSGWLLLGYKSGSTFRPIARLYPSTIDAVLASPKLEQLRIELLGRLAYSNIKTECDDNHFELKTPYFKVKTNLLDSSPWELFDKKNQHTFSTLSQALEWRAVSGER